VLSYVLDASSGRGTYLSTGATLLHFFNAILLLTVSSYLLMRLYCRMTW